VRLHGDGLDLLGIESKPDSGEGLDGTQLREGAVVVAGAIAYAMTGTIEPVKSIIGGQFYAVAGGMAGVVVIFAIIGMVLGKKS